MKHICRILIFLFIAGFSLSCAQDPETGAKSFFSDTDLITITSPAVSGSQLSSSTVISFSLPAGCSYYVVGLFNAQPVLSSNNTIGNPSALIFGTSGSSSVSGKTAGSLKGYNQSTGEFSGAVFTGMTVQGYLLIWGYDSEMNLKASSSGSFTVIP